jgi:hypothetical protein
MPDQLRGVSTSASLERDQSGTQRRVDTAGHKPTARAGAGNVELDDVYETERQLRAALPWCSRVGLRSSSGVAAIICGPAKLAADWYLPVIGPKVRSRTTPSNLSARMRRDCGSHSASGRWLLSNGELKNAAARWFICSNHSNFCDEI